MLTLYVVSDMCRRVNTCSKKRLLTCSLKTEDAGVPVLYRVADNRHSNAQRNCCPCLFLHIFS